MVPWVSIEVLIATEIKELIGGMKAVGILGCSVPVEGPATIEMKEAICCVSGEEFDEVVIWTSVIETDVEGTIWVLANCSVSINGVVVDEAAVSTNVVSSGVGMAAEISVRELVTTEKPSVIGNIRDNVDCVTLPAGAPSREEEGWDSMLCAPISVAEEVMDWLS
jgi:hypothetical protein